MQHDTVWWNYLAKTCTPASSPQILCTESNKSGSSWKLSGNLCDKYIISSATYTFFLTNPEFEYRSGMTYEILHVDFEILRKCPKYIFGDSLTYFKGLISCSSSPFRVPNASVCDSLAIYQTENTVMQLSDSGHHNSVYTKKDRWLCTHQCKAHATALPGAIVTKAERLLTKSF